MMDEKLHLQTAAIFRSAIVITVATLVSHLDPLFPLIWAPRTTALILALVLSALVLFGVDVYEAVTLGRRQRYPVRESTDSGQGGWLAVSGGAKQLAGLAAKLVDAGAARKLGHDVSSRPRLACGLGKKTVLPEKHYTGTEVDSGPAREPGGALSRRQVKLTVPASARSAR